MQSRRLQLNTAKTEVLWCVPSLRQHQLPQVAMRVHAISYLQKVSVKALAKWNEIWHASWVMGQGAPAHFHKTGLSCVGMGLDLIPSSRLFLPCVPKINYVSPVSNHPENFITRSSADADKPARHVYRSVNVTKHSTIPYIRYSFLLCNSNFVFKTHRFFTMLVVGMCRWPALIVPTLISETISK